jgi:hypothetical protein
MNHPTSNSTFERAAFARDTSEWIKAGTVTFRCQGQRQLGLAVPDGPDIHAARLYWARRLELLCISNLLGLCAVKRRDTVTLILGGPVRTLIGSPRSGRRDHFIVHLCHHPTGSPETRELRRCLSRPSLRSFRWN